MTPSLLAMRMDKGSRSLTHYAEEQSFVLVSKSFRGSDDVSFKKVENKNQNKTLLAISARWHIIHTFSSLLEKRRRLTMNNNNKNSIVWLRRGDQFFNGNLLGNGNVDSYAKWSVINYKQLQFFLLLALLHFSLQLPWRDLLQFADVSQTLRGTPLYPADWFGQTEFR